MDSQYIDIKNILQGWLLRDGSRRPRGQHIAGVTEVQLTDFENEFSVKVPSCLRAWLSVVNGFAFTVPLYGVRLSSYNDFLDMGHDLRYWPDWIDNGWFPVAGDGCGNHYVLFSEGSRNPVAFVECELDPSVLSYVMASSLPLFLQSFVLRELSSFEAVPGDEAMYGDWPFDKRLALEVDPDLLDIKSAPLPWEA